MTFHTTTVVLIIAFAMGLAAVAYRDYADAHGWPVGALYSSDKSLIMIMAFFTVFGAPVLGFLFTLSWQSPVAIMVFGLLLGHLATKLLRRHLQLAVLVVLPLCWALVFGIFLPQYIP